MLLLEKEVKYQLKKGIGFRIHQRHPSGKRPMALKDLASLARFLLV